ncbi:MAG: hypothetical protein ACFFDW_16505 [Candidatus Thorarchaeota archaeon]
MTLLDTEFAPAERLDNDEIFLQTIKILGLRQILPVLNILPNLVTIVNKERQVIYANDAFSKAIGIENFEESLGGRPGELLSCIHSMDHVFGCGTGKECRHCGVVLTILKSQETNQKEEDIATIIVIDKGVHIAKSFKVVVSPIIVENNTFYFLILVED